MTARYYWTIALGFAAALLVATPQVGAAQNVGDVLLEYGFEDGVDENGVPVGASLVELSADSTAEFILEEADVNSGNYAYSIKSREDTLALNARVDVDMPDLEYGAYYELSVYIKTSLEEGGAVYARNSWLDGIILGPVGGEVDWTEYTAEFQFLGGPVEAVRLHVTGVGQVWFDDVTITKSGDTQTNFVNQSFEIPNSDATGPAGWEGQPNLGTQNPDRYAWDNTVAHTGDYSVLIQVTQADLDAGSIDAAWRTSFPFENGAWYEVSAWVRTEDLGTNRFYFNMVYNNQSFGVMNQDTGGEWVEVVDTVQFAADFPLNNANRNLIRFRVGGSIQEGTQPKVWLDDVNIRLIGRAPHFSDEITAISDGEGTVHLSWEPSPGTENAVYHILMQPTSFENNLVQNPSFEIPNEAGSGPANWNIRELSPSAGGHTQLDEAIPEWPIEDAPPGGGQFSVSLRSEDLMSDKGAVIYFGQSIQTQAHFAYWFSTWVKTEDLFVPTGMIYSETYGDSLWKGGASIQTWTGNRSANSDPWIQSFGINTVIGTTDWHQMGVPVTHAQMTYYNNYVAVGIGEFPSWGASGQAWFDMVSVVPFEEVATTSNTSITLQNVPDSVEYFAVFVEDDVDGPDTYSKLNVSPAYVTKAIVNVAVGREELPDRITLYQNYPNPFNPATTIEYAIPRSAPVTLTVFDMLGRRVATLMENRVMEAGTHRISFDARDLASGIYVYRLEVGNQIETRMMQLLK